MRNEFTDHHRDWQIGTLAGLPRFPQTQRASGCCNRRRRKGHVGSKVPPGTIQLLTLAFARHASSLTYGRVSQLYVERQKLSLKGEAKSLDDNSILATAGIHDGGELVVKDLGPQVSWRTVFVAEYVRFFFCLSILSTYRHRLNFSKKRLDHSSFTQLYIIYPECSTAALCNTANCKSAYIISLERHMEFDYKLGTFTQWSSYTLPNARSSRYCTQPSGCFAHLVLINRPSHPAFIGFRTRPCLWGTFSRSKLFTSSNGPSSHACSALSTIIFSQVFTSALFTPVMNSSVRRAFPSISNIRSDICCKFAVHQRYFPI